MNKTKDINELRVFRDKTFAGTLTRTNLGCEFRFDEEFLRNEEYSEISFCIEKTMYPVMCQGVNLHPFFAGLLPEGLRLKAIKSRLKTSEDDLFSLFAAIGDNAIGDVYIEAFGKLKERLAPKLKEINFYDYFQNVVSSNDILNDESIAGVQEKISASMICFPINIAKKDFMYILKLNPEDKPNLVENEFYCMELARKCGLDVAKTKIVKDKDGNSGLLVTRFDRIWNIDRSSFSMHHQEDACQFLDKYPREKYRVSFNDIAQGVEKHVPASKVAILKLLRLFAFSYLIGNGDLHGKNISLLSKSGKQITEVSPAYDLLCSYIYGDHKMAIRLDGRDDNLKRSTFVEFGKRFGIADIATNKMLDKLLVRFNKHVEIIDRIPMDNKSLILIKKVMKKRVKDLDLLTEKNEI